MKIAQPTGFGKRTWRRLVLLGVAACCAAPLRMVAAEGATAEAPPGLPSSDGNWKAGAEGATVASPDAAGSTTAVDVAAAPLPYWVGDGCVYATNGWKLTVTYLQRGTRSEGQHGVLERAGQEVALNGEGAQLDTPLGTLKYYGNTRSKPWSITGWNFADRRKIRPARFVKSRPAPENGGE
jgi:hypothetical protein